MSKFENIILRCVRFLFGRWLSENLKLELDEMINPRKENFCCDMAETEEEQKRLDAIEEKSEK